MVTVNLEIASGVSGRVVDGDWTLGLPLENGKTQICEHAKNSKLFRFPQKLFSFIYWELNL